MMTFFMMKRLDYHVTELILIDYYHFRAPTQFARLGFQPTKPHHDWRKTAASCISQQDLASRRHLQALFDGSSQFFATHGSEDDGAKGCVPRFPYDDPSRASSWYQSSTLSMWWWSFALSISPELRPISKLT